MTPTPDPLAVARLVTDLFERLGIRYSIGGSMASAFSGEPRSTLDVDIVAALLPSHVEPVVAALTSAFYLNPAALERAVASRSSSNIIHVATSVKIDIFVAGGTPLDEALLARRVAVRVGDPPVEFFVHAPEDILLQKLRCYRLGGETSDRQWRDAIGIVRTQGTRLDRAYLEVGARTLGVEDLLQRAEAGPAD